MLLYQEDAELLFPTRLIPLLRDLRGEEFHQLVNRIQQHHTETNQETLGFILMMIRLANCITCTPDSYRAMNGCTRCAVRTVRAYKGDDSDLIHHWQTACRDVEAWLETGVQPQD